MGGYGKTVNQRSSELAGCREVQADFIEAFRSLLDNIKRTAGSVDLELH